MIRYLMQCSVAGFLFLLCFQSVAAADKPDPKTVEDFRVRLEAFAVACREFVDVASQVKTEVDGKRLADKLQLLAKAEILRSYEAREPVDGQDWVDSSCFRGRQRWIFIGEIRFSSERSCS